MNGQTLIGGGDVRYGVAPSGGVYYKINGLRSLDVYANNASARHAAGRQQQHVVRDGETYLRPVPELVEW